MNLQPSIRSFLLADTTFANYLTTYNGSKALFTRRPVPTDASYPLAIISPVVTYRQNDYLTKKKFTITHDLLVFDNNESSANYRNVEAAAERARDIMHRLPVTSFASPAGYKLIQCLADFPVPGATDDLIKVSRVVQLQFDLIEE